MKQWATPSGCLWVIWGIIVFSLVTWYVLIKCAVWFFKLIF